MTRRQDTARLLRQTIAGRWNVVALLGEGGTARVFSAVSPEGERVAVKILRADFTAHPGMRARFVREARATKVLTHRGIVRILDDGTLPSGEPYLVMEHLDGESLEERWKRKGLRLPVSEVLWVADQALDALAEAHKKGIVHRDIKPDNLFLTHDRRLKLLDFGIAGLREDLARVEEIASEGEGETTQIGSIMGTPAFMPPEQARGDWGQVGVQTDLWSVGATMYTLLSGRLVHEEHALIDQLRAAIQRPAPSIGEVAPGTPEPVVQLIDLALRFDAQHRWPSARAMQSALRLAYGDWRRETSLPEDIEDALDLRDDVVSFQRPAPPPLSGQYVRPPAGSEKG
jgi:serine/threonine-protein kinase